MAIWKKAFLWTKIKDTLGLGGIIAQGGIEAFNQAGIEAFKVNPKVQLFVAAGTAIGYLVGMWMEDRDKDGIVDLFQLEDKKEEDKKDDKKIDGNV